MKSNNPSEKYLTKNKQFVNLFVIAVMATITAVVLFKDQSISELWSAVSKVNPVWLLVGIAVMVIFFGIEALSLHTLLKSFGCPLTFRRCYSYSLTDFYFSSITPGCCGGQPALIYYMQRDNIGIGTSSISLLLFNTAYHSAAVIIAAVVLLSGNMEAVIAAGPLKYLLIYGFITQFVLTVLFLLIIFSDKIMPCAINIVVNMLIKLPFIKEKDTFRQKVNEQIIAYKSSAKHIKSQPLIMFKLIALLLVHLILYYSITFFVYKAFGLSSYTLVNMIAIQSALTLAMESLPVPGGIGLTEVGFLAVYSTIFGSASVVPAVLLCRGINYYTFLLAGGINTAILHISQNKQTEKSQCLSKSKTIIVATNKT